MPTHPSKPFVGLLFGVVAVSWAAIFVRLCDAPSTVIAAYRLGIAVILLAAGSGWLGRSQGPWALRHRGSWVLLSGTSLGLHFICWIEAVQRIPIVLAVTLSSTHPIFVGILSWVLFGERIGLRLATGIVLSLAGTLSTGWSDEVAIAWDWQGYLLAFGASVFFAGYLMVGRKLRRTVGLVAYVLPTYGVAALLLSALAVASGLPLIGFDLRTYVMFALLAVVPTVIGHSTLNWALRYVSATLVATSVLGEPVGATLLAAIFLNEVPGLLMVGSGLVILMGIYMAAREEIVRLGHG